VYVKVSVLFYLFRYSIARADLNKVENYMTNINQSIKVKVHTVYEKAKKN